MKTEHAPARQGADVEISALIRTLHEAGERLEELTAGEVDTVLDRAGRPFLLRHAQERLRISESARQASILNALPAHIALLDPAGRIVAVNEGWRVFAGANGLHARDGGIGLDYLQVCDRAVGPQAAEAQPVAAGIRAVLAGTAPGYTIEYPCDSATEPRWYLLNVTPTDGEPPRGAVVMHLDISEQRRSRDALLESERRFSDMLGNVELVSVMLDCDGQIAYCNDYLLRLSGWQREEIIGQSWFRLFIPPGDAAVNDAFAALQANAPDARHYENEILTRAGARRLIRWSNSVLRSTRGEVIGTASIGEDITERKAAQDRVAYLNRIYGMLSGINTLIVRVRDRAELFREACRIAVEIGGFRVALMGTLDRSTMKLAIAGLAGESEELLAAIRKILVADDGALNPLTERVINQKAALVSNDSQNDPRVLRRTRHAKAGISSMAILPILVADEVAGVLALYASERNFFHAEEIKLLVELAGDIAFAIDHIEKRERLDYLAYYDVLTGLANRSLFLERLEQFMRGAGRDGHQLAVMVVDVERFRNINESLGRAGGDALLRQVADWLKSRAGGSGFAARVGTDLFAFVVPELAAVDNLARFVELMQEAFAEHPFRLDDAVLRIAVKVGVAVFPDDAVGAEALFGNAEAALRKAKARGDRYLRYDHHMTDITPGKLSLEHLLRRAFELDEFVLHYQPVIDAATGVIASAEALIRWNDPQTGLVPPARFIPILEESGMIHEVGRWVLRTAIGDCMRWHAAGLAAVRVAVNVSSLQLRHRDYVAELGREIDRHQGAAARLDLEITESLIMEDVKHSIASLQAIRALGVRVSIDDFGTGFSSLSYLARLPVDTLKIDRSFVAEMTVSPQGLALVSTVINLAHALQLGVVGEGVETDAQARLLRLLKCDRLQGFLFSKALPCAGFESTWLAAGTTQGAQA